MCHDSFRRRNLPYYGAYIMIRLATYDDFDAILDMCEEFWGHTQFEEPFERDHAEKMVQLSFDQGLLLVADDGGVFGVIFAIKSPLIGSTKAWTATEIAWWVNPKKRGKLAGVQLIAHLERLCIEQEVRYLNLAYMQSSMPDTVRKLYEKLGYKLQETLYTKVLYGFDNSGNYSGGSGPTRGL